MRDGEDFVKKTSRASLKLLVASASQSILKHGFGIIEWSATVACRLLTHGGRLRLAGFSLRRCRARRR